ncbi:type VI secretion system Vgr family protein [Massilia genomosp. 1]|uniref:Type VI secretion system tip protein VgrG n=1 Tax=Massilia genomosp. 1 TaxID=2609280 RepID=A0ABX0MUK8_9BURK|nr:type VI secretion system tip protein VgrG [Massilia genomosp. 1]NHZ66131.1 type VI secretion system tip protein VgrG [Massilia genomosp. 1]
MAGHADSALTTLAVQAAAPLDSLFVQSLSGSETLNGLFMIEIACRTTDAALDLEAALGQHVTVGLGAASAVRLLDGMCARIRQRPADSGYALYTLELRPWLWWLTLSSDNRIFQAKSVPEIVEAVFAAGGYQDYELKLSGSYAARDYCVQYGETDFAFVARLLEEEGIFYFFRHQAGHHLLVLADTSDAFPPCPGAAAIAFVPAATGGREQQCIYAGELGQQAVSAGFRTADFAFATPAAALTASATAGAGGPAHYDYPGGYASKAQGDAIATRRAQAQGAGARQLNGQSDSRALVPGHTFQLTGHERADANAAWVVSALSHEASHERYTNDFSALPGSVAYRPPRTSARPRIHGSQTAIVVGKEGEEIWTDAFGRIKVQFHWDRAGKRDENSSCWVRVAQSWTGKGWGGQFIPRIGQEVVVSFLDGDPDRPLVTGCVYNGANAPPYGLPAEQTRSGIKSNSSPGGEGFNELRFEDKKDAEELYLHAQKDMKTDVLHDAIAVVGNDDSRKIKQNQTLELEEGNRSVTLSKGNLSTTLTEGNESLSVKGTRALAIEGAETHDNKADFTHQVDGGYVLTIKGDLTIDVQGEIKFKGAAGLAIEAGKALSAKAGTTLAAEAGTELSNKAGTTLALEAATSLSSKAGASQTIDGGGMLTLKGGMVKIN